MTSRTELGVPAAFSTSAGINPGVGGEFSLNLTIPYGPGLVPPSTDALKVSSKKDCTFHRHLSRTQPT